MFGFGTWYQRHKKYGYPPDKRDDAVDIVMEHTKLMCENETI